MYALNERVIGQFWAKVLLPDHSGCMLWTSAVDRDGYGQFSIRLGTRVNAKAHRLSAQLAGLEIDGQIVMHGCDVRRCVAPDHLSIGSHSDNAADKVSKRRHTFGENHVQAQLTNAVAADIARRFLAGDRQSDIARSYGIGRGRVYRIVSGRQWRSATAHLLGSYWASRQNLAVAGHKHPDACRVGCQCRFDGR